MGDDTAEPRTGLAARGMIARAGRALRHLVNRFSADRSGQVFVIFGLSMFVLVVAVGAGIDLANAYVTRQKLSNVATLTCQYANRTDVANMINNGPTGVTSYNTAVNAFYTNTVAQQSFLSSSVFKTTNSSTPFNYTRSSTPSVTASGTINNNFMQIIGVKTLTLSVTVNCGAPLTTPPGANPLTESFEHSNCSGQCTDYILPNDPTTNSPNPNPTTTTPTGVSYYGASGAKWKTIGYCLEIDTQGQIVNTVPDGTHEAELDCDNGNPQADAGNSSISTLVPLKVGTYELRYNYLARVTYPNYSPTYICGSSASDLTWATDIDSTSNNITNALRTNQINVYLDQDGAVYSAGTIPTHLTLTGQTLGGSNLIDMCVYSANWIQRSVLINVTTAGNYWLTFAADGASDSFGGQIDKILLCNTSCASVDTNPNANGPNPNGAVQDNFPFTANQLLFEEQFETPKTSEGCTGCGNANSTLNTSYGSSPGWPNQVSRGRAAAPYNQVTYEFTNGTQGNQYIQVEGYQASGQTTSNRSISRFFYLDPGYYQISYDYVSDIQFLGQVGPYCTSPPYTASSLTGYSTSDTVTSAGINRLTGAISLTYSNDTDQLAVFMSQSTQASYPNGAGALNGNGLGGVYSGGVLNSTTQFTNPDLSVSTTPTVPPDALSMASYNTSQVNQLIDFCGYSVAWVTPRTTYVKITKPGQYWLTFSSRGNSDNYGAAIDDVKLTAVGSLYTTSSSYPSLAIRTAAVTIPTSGPAPGSTILYTGFSITADRLTP